MKISNDYVKADGRYDISKIPEICDNIKFDNLHIPDAIEDNVSRLDLMELSQMLCRVIVPMEYGITTNEKIEVGCQIMKPLLKKVHRDLLWWRDRDRVVSDTDGAQAGRK